MITVLDKQVFPITHIDGSIHLDVLEDSLISNIREYKDKFITIKWTYENIDEFFVLMQLADLITNINKRVKLELFCTYLPYSYASSSIENNRSFGVHTFTYLLSNFFEKVTYINSINLFGENEVYQNILPLDTLRRVITTNEYDTIVLFDSTLKTVYQPHLSDKELLNIEECRINITGNNILVLIDNLNNINKNIFAQYTSQIKMWIPHKMSLWVTHACVVHDKKYIYNSGYRNIYSL